jgi:hypothetical protein
VEKVLEGYRNTRDQDRALFFANQTCSDPCGTFGDNDMFSCSMTCSFTPIGNPNRVDLSVTISWEDGDIPLSLTVPTVFTLYDI